MPTERFPLTAEIWTDLGPTPCFVQLEHVYSARFVIDTGPPASLDAPAHGMTSDGEMSWCDIGLFEGQRVYARALEHDTVLVVSR